MKFSELLNNDVDTLRDTKMRLSDLGAVNFGTGVTDKNESRTPHYEMRTGIEMFENNPIVNSGLYQLLNFVIPNKEVKISSDDEWTKEWLEEWHKQRRGILEEYKNIWLTNRMTGNGFLERFYTQDDNTGKYIIDNLFSINDSSRIYVNPDGMGTDVAYIFELPIGIKPFEYAGEMVTPNYWSVRYIKNYQFTFQRVYGFPIPDWKLSHFKSGWCLPFASQIETENGKEAIGDLVKNKKQVKIKTWNAKEEKFEYKKIVDWLKRPYKEDFYKVYISTNKNEPLTCTKEHPILTKKGYVPAEELTIEDYVAVKINKEDKEQLIYVKIDKIETESIKTKHGSQTVYDLEVEDNHNFVTKNIVVHNSRDNIYGRSQLVAGTDAHNIMQEIMSSWDTISRTRQIDQKIISVADSETGLQVPQSRLDEIGEVLDNADKSYTLFNIPLKLLSQDINTSGNYDLMEGVFDILRRMLITSLLPNHLTPWSDSGTTQGAEAAMPPLLGRIKAAQAEYIGFLNEAVIDELRKSESRIADDATFIFDEPKIIDDAYYINKMLQLVQDDIITRETAKDYLLKMGILDAQIFENLESEDEEDEMPKKDDEPKDDKPYKPKNTKDANKQPFQKPKSSESIETEVFLKLDENQSVESFKEAKVSNGMTLFTFKRRMKDKNPKLETTGWSQIKSKNVGGHDLRMIHAQDTVMLFDGLQIIETVNDRSVDKATLDKMFQKLVDKTEEDFEKFTNETSLEDKLVDELDKKIKAELNNRLARVLKTIDNNSVKKESFTEAFLSLNIFPKINNIFKTFDIDKIIGDTLNKLGVDIIEGDENPVVDGSIKNFMNRKKQLMVQNIKQQAKRTTDKMVGDIQNTLTQGIASGLSVSDIKKQVNKQYKYDSKANNKFKRMVQYNMNTSSKVLKLQKYKSMGYKTVIWLDRDDSKVRPEHKKMHHREFDIDWLLKKIGDGSLPGGLFGCRCTVIGGNQ